MNLDAQQILSQLSALIPRECRQDLLLVGSLAAAVHFSRELGKTSLATKDADFIVQSTTDLGRAVKVAEELRMAGWRIRNESGLAPGKTADGDLPHVKLYSPLETEFWIEFQGLPKPDQQEPRKDVPVVFAGQYYSLPCYRYMRLVIHEPQSSGSDLRYAAPRMMALANLLAHSKVGDARVTLPGGRKGGLRSAKDLGRAVALSRLTPPAELEEWPGSWLPALQSCHPTSWREAAATADRGLDELLSQPDAVQEAIEFALSLGLLGARDAAPEPFKAMADQLLQLAVRPFQEAALRG